LRLPANESSVLERTTVAVLTPERVRSRQSNGDLRNPLSLTIVGTEWLVDANGCDPEALCSLELLQTVFQRTITDLNLQVVGEIVWHHFPPPGGVTGMALLSESHLTCHTYPEHGLATINLYCCRARPEWSWAAQLHELLGARDVRVRAIKRYVATAAGATLEQETELALAEHS
jgi:S-adenosylmethionine decarboxylase